MVLVGVVAAYIFGIPLTANILNHYIQSYEPLSAEALAQSGAGAIVVLAGGLYQNAPEYHDDTVHLRTLGRVRYAARLARASKLPVVASGGGVNEDKDDASRSSEAKLMGRLLQEEFGINNVIIESGSRNTRENTINTAKLLRSLGINSIVLVTNAAHMPRAVVAFQRQHIRVTPAPTLFFPRRPEPLDIESWLPSVVAMYQMRYALHEVLGRMWYWWRDG